MPYSNPQSQRPKDQGQRLTVRGLWDRPDVQLTFLACLVIDAKVANDFGVVSMKQREAEPSTLTDYPYIRLKTPW
jgi:hypothetical protein